MSLLRQICTLLTDLMHQVKRRVRKLFRSVDHVRDNEQMYEVIQQLRNEELNDSDSSSSSSDSISSYGYGDQVSPLSSSNNSLA